MAQWEEVLAHEPDDGSEFGSQHPRGRGGELTSSTCARTK